MKIKKEYEKKQSLLFQMKPLSFEKMGSKLIRVSCYLLGTGINRNGSNITKDAVIKANEKLAHLPVVGHLIQDEDGSYYLGGHDIQITDRGNDWEIEPLTVALGCIAGDKDFEFVTLKEFEGTEKEQEREYLKVDMIIWNHMSPVFEAAYSKDVYFNHSIEIDGVMGDWDATNNFRIDTFEYSKACLLGLSDEWNKHVEPCFPESKVYPVEYSVDSDFNKQFALLMQEIKEFNLEKSTDDNSNLDILDDTFEKNGNEKEDKQLGKRKEILFDDVRAKINSQIAESTYSNENTNKRYSKYIGLTINENDSNVIVVDREDLYKAYSIPYIVTDSNEGIHVKLDYENKQELVLGAVDKTDALFNVNDEVLLMSKDTADYSVSSHTNSRIQDLSDKLTEKTAEFEELTLENEKLVRQLTIFESEREQYATQKHKDMIDTLISSRREEMGKFSEFLEYCNALDYSKTVEEIQSDLKEVHYNFMLKNNSGRKYAFSTIESSVIDDMPSEDSLVNRWGEDIVKYLKNK